jgi:hypothetical protein
MNNYIDVYIHMIAMIIILCFNIVYSILLIIYPDIYIIIKLLAIVVLISSIYISAKRATYLPFLGQCVAPPSLFSQEIAPQGATETYTIELDNIPDGTRVIYWGAVSSNGNKDKSNKSVVKKNPMEAYGNYSNTGVTTVKDKKAMIYFNCPDKYNVGPFIKTVDRHIHYRLILPDNPMMSQVFTTYVSC